jgi:cyclase
MSSGHHDHPGAGPARTEEVADGVFAYIQPDGSWWINNTGFLVGARGVVSVDACSTDRRTLAYRDAIAEVTPLPVRTLINTHHHGDHTYGNHRFAGATIVAHEETRRQVLAAGLPNWGGAWDPVDWGELELAPPFLTYEHAVNVYVDDLRCEVRHVGTPAHTTNDSIVWVPERGVLFAGDLAFNGGTPFLLMGSIAGAIEVVRDLRRLPAEVVVPGHGDVCGPEVFDDMLRYLTFVQETAAAGRAAGLTPLRTALETDLGEFSGWLDPERVAGNLHRAYAELDGAPRGGRIDLAAALGDMITYNGGRPLTCYA